MTERKDFNEAEHRYTHALFSLIEIIQNIEDARSEEINVPADVIAIVGSLGDVLKNITLLKGKQRPSEFDPSKRIYIFDKITPKYKVTLKYDPEAVAQHHHDIALTVIQRQNSEAAQRYVMCYLLSYDTDYEMGVEGLFPEIKFGKDSGDNVDFDNAYSITPDLFDQITPEELALACRAYLRHLKRALSGLLKVLPFATQKISITNILATAEGIAEDSFRIEKEKQAFAILSDLQDLTADDLVTPHNLIDAATEMCRAVKDLVIARGKGANGEATFWEKLFDDGYIALIINQGGTTIDFVPDNPVGYTAHIVGAFNMFLPESQVEHMAVNPADGTEGLMVTYGTGEGTKTLTITNKTDAEQCKQFAEFMIKAARLLTGSFE